MMGRWCRGGGLGVVQRRHRLAPVLADASADKGAPAMPIAAAAWAAWLRWGHPGPSLLS